MGSLNYHKLDGYRKHAGSENKSTYVKFTHQKNDILQADTPLDSPYAFDAGGLTLEEVNRNRSQGRERNIIFDSGESVASPNCMALQNHTKWRTRNHFAFGI